MSSDRESDVKSHPKCAEMIRHNQSPDLMTSMSKRNATDSPFAPQNDLIKRDDPFAPWNDPMKRDDPFAAWNNPFGHGKYEQEARDY